MKKSIAIVLIAYRRHRTLGSIIDQCLKSKLGPVIVFLDGPKSDKDRADVVKVREIVKRYEIDSLGMVRLIESDINLGSAGNVIRALDSIFGEFESAVVLEDDCFPSLDFFDFAVDVIPILENSSSLYLASGSQFFSVAEQKLIVSSYPLIWGWVTTKKKWTVLKKAYEHKLRFRDFPRGVKWRERMFWLTGQGRAFRKEIDAWDISLAAFMVAKQFLAVHSSANLISNFGNDLISTHVPLESDFCNRPFQKYFSSDLFIESIPEYDDHIRKQIYGISNRHFFTGIIRQIGFILR